MESYEKKILNSLLDSYENSLLFTGENKVAVNIEFPFRKKKLPSYFDESSMVYEEIHEAMKHLEQKGWIRICWKKGKENHIIDKVLLCEKSADEIYVWLHRKSKKTQLDVMQKVLERYRGKTLPPAMSGFLEWTQERLAANKSVKEYLDIFDEAQTIRFLDGLLATEENKEECFIREFSIRRFADSKAFEHISGRITRVLRDFIPDFAELSEEEVLAEYQIYHTPNYVYLKGNAVITVLDQRIDLSKFSDGIGFAGNDLPKMIFETGLPVKKVITIENLTTFFRWKEEHSLIVYLGGYHNRVRRELLHKMYESFPKAQWLHFGDIDCGGFQIYLHLKERTGIPFEMYHMDILTLECYKEYGRPLSVNDRNRLKELQTYSEIKDIAQWMLEHGIKLEQECIQRLGKFLVTKKQHCTKIKV